jgi:hypothetical protein
MRTAARRLLPMFIVAVFTSVLLYAQEDLTRKQHLSESIVAAREGLTQRWYSAKVRQQLIDELAARPVAELEALAADPRRDIGPRVLGDTSQHLVFTPVVPCRIVDTRVVGGAMNPGETRDFKVTGAAHQAQGGSVLGCGVASGPTSAVLNIVAVDASGGGHLRAWAYSTPPVGPPLAAVLTFAPGINISNGIPVPICDPTTTLCSFDFRIYAAGSSVHLVIDVVGFFSGRAVSDADVAPGAGIAESKLALNFPTHSNANDPTPNEKAALLGTSGVPSGANPFVTHSDPRNTNARFPLVHGDSAHDATVASLSGGLVPTAELGTGTANSSTFLRGDRSYQVVGQLLTQLQGNVVAPNGITGYFNIISNYTPPVNARAFSWVRCSYDGSAAGQVIYMRAAIRTPTGGTSQTGNSYYLYTHTAAPNASVMNVNFDFFDLTAGQSYDFGVDFFLTTPTGGVNTDYCTATVMIMQR